MRGWLWVRGCMLAELGAPELTFENGSVPPGVSICRNGSLKSHLPKQRGTLHLYSVSLHAAIPSDALLLSLTSRRAVCLQ